MGSYIVSTLIPLAAIAVILASSLNVMVGYGRMYSLAQAALYGVGAYTAALVAFHVSSDAIVAGLCAMAVAGLTGLVLAIIGFRVKLEYFVIASLGFQVVFGGVANNAIGLTGGQGGLSGIPVMNVLGIPVATPGANALATGLLAGAVVAGLELFKRSAWGRQLEAVGEDELGAAAVGKRIVAARSTAAVVTGSCAGLAGALYANYAAFVNPASFNDAESVTILAMVIIGGAGTSIGPILGAVLLTVIPALLNLLSLSPATAGLWEQLVFGLMVVVIVRFRPDGLAGPVGDWTRFVRRGSTGKKLPGFDWRWRAEKPQPAPAAIGSATQLSSERQQGPEADL